MSLLEDYPLGIGTIFRSMVSGLGLVWAPLAAVLLGLFLGLLAIGVHVPDARWLLAFLLGLAIMTWTSIPTFAIGLAMLGFWLRFLLSEEGRVEALVILCCLAQWEMVLLFCADQHVDWGVWDVLRAGGIFLAVPAAYVGLRLVARRRQRAFERQIAEDRMARLRGDVVAGTAADRAAIPSAALARGERVPPSPPRPARPPENRTSD
jgi:hypothetical protein